MKIRRTPKHVIQRRKLARLFCWQKTFVLWPRTIEVAEEEEEVHFCSFLYRRMVITQIRDPMNLLGEAKKSLILKTNDTHLYVPKDDRGLDEVASRLMTAGILSMDGEFHKYFGDSNGMRLAKFHWQYKTKEQVDILLL